jgi:hypothetical protein
VEHFKASLTLSSWLARRNIVTTTHPIINHVTDHKGHFVVALEKLMGLLDNANVVHRNSMYHFLYRLEEIFCLPAKMMDHVESYFI